MPDTNPTLRNFILGIAGTLIAAFVTYFFQQRLGDQQRVLKVEELNQNKMFKDQEVEDKHQTLMLSQLENVKSANRKLAASSGDYYSLGLKNNCNEKVHVALSYVALDESQIVIGWLNVNPGEASFLHDANTASRNFYFYSNIKSYNWYDSLNGLALIMCSDAFDYVLSVSFCLGCL
jgi:hypothetical protein